MSVASAAFWDLDFQLNQYCINEILFWQKNLKIANVKGHWQPKFLLHNLKVLTHLRMKIVLIPCQSLLFKSYSRLNIDFRPPF